MKSNFFKIGTYSILFFSIIFCSSLKGQDLITMQNAVDEWAKMQLTLGGTNNQKKKLVSASIIYDKVTKKYYYGMNEGIFLKKAVIHPTLVAKFPKVTLNTYPLGNCSECDGTNQALHDGSNWNNLQMYTVSVYFKTSTTALQENCANCRYTFKDIEILK